MTLMIKDEIPQIKASTARKFGSAHSVPLLFFNADTLALSAGSQYFHHLMGITVSGPTLHLCETGLIESLKVDESAN